MQGGTAAATTAAAAAPAGCACLDARCHDGGMLNQVAAGRAQHGEGSEQHGERQVSGHWTQGGQAHAAPPAHAAAADTDVR